MKLLLIAPSTRAMAESAKRAGYSFVSLDYFGDVDQKKICENYSLNHEFKEEFTIENLFKHAKDLNFTHVVYGSGFENRPELIEDFEKTSVVLGNDAKTLKKVRNWRYFFRKLENLGIAHPNTEIIKGEIKKEILEGKILKPINTGGGHGIFTRENFSDFVPSDEEYLLQDFIEGVSASSLVISNGDKVEFICATEQILDNFRYCGTIIPLKTEKRILREIEETSIKICEEFNLLGCNGIDFIIKEKPYVIEVNPRITGSVEVAERALKINIFDLHVKACFGEKIKIKTRTPNNFYYKKIVFSKKDIKFNLKFENLPLFVKDIPHFGERIFKDKPICTIIGKGEKRDEVMREMRERENNLINLVNNLS